jgi:repressor LexA
MDRGSERRWRSGDFFLTATQKSGILLSVNRLTTLQRQVLDVFRQRASAGAPPPTYRELCKEFGWRSTGTARDHLKALVRKGALDAAGGRARGAHLHRGPIVGTVLLPLVGRVVAGEPVISEECVEAEILVPTFLVPSGDAFLLRVSGDSMEGAGILEGDIVVIRRTEEPSAGDIVVATVSGETTLKRLERWRRAWVLAAENPRYGPIPIDTEDTTIHGVVVGVLRTLRGSIGPLGLHLPSFGEKAY